MQTEHWRPLVGFEGRYLVSNHGRVVSIWFKGKPRAKPKPMSAHAISKHGHQSVCLTKDGREYSYAVSRAVITAFKGLPPNELSQCAHEDGSPLNNHIDNLTWKTCKENQHDRIRHNTDPIGDRNPSAKLSNDVIESLRADSEIMKTADLAAKYGISMSHTRKIVRGKIRGRSNPTGNGDLPYARDRKPGDPDARVKLPRDQIAAVFADTKTMRTVDICAKYGLGPSHVRRIARGEVKAPESTLAA